MENTRILVVDDDEVGRKNLSRLLKKDGYHVAAAADGARALAMISGSAYDVVLTDLIMEDVSGLDLLAHVKRISPDTEVILLTAFASVPTAIEAIKNGAYQYLEKPFQPDKLRHLVRMAVEKSDLLKKVKDLESRIDGAGQEPQIIGESRGILSVVKLIRQVACADCNVLITGESGTGKELAASLLHFHSPRKKEKFLAVNCGAFSEELLANELFGHEKEAFTGAAKMKRGLLETASGGTLMLDEVGDMPLSMQVKLLRVLEEQELIRVGGNSPVPIDVRIVAATNQDLKKAMNARLFRQDLFFRLNVVSIDIPPLRERKTDIPLLAHYFLNKSAKKNGKTVCGISDEALDILLSYDYPGNVRELENIIARAVVISAEDTICARDLPPDLLEMEFFTFQAPDSKIQTLKEMQGSYINWVLNQTGGNKSKAAKLLGIDRASIWRFLRKTEIED